MVSLPWRRFASALGRCTGRASPLGSSPASLGAFHSSAKIAQGIEFFRLERRQRTRARRTAVGASASASAKARTFAGRAGARCRTIGPDADWAFGTRTHGRGAIRCATPEAAAALFFFAAALGFARDSLFAAAFFFFGGNLARLFPATVAFLDGFLFDATALVVGAPLLQRRLAGFQLSLGEAALARGLLGGGERILRRRLFWLRAHDLGMRARRDLEAFLLGLDHDRFGAPVREALLHGALVGLAAQGEWAPSGVVCVFRIGHSLSFGLQPADPGKDPGKGRLGVVNFPRPVDLLRYAPSRHLLRQPACCSARHA